MPPTYRSTLHYGSERHFCPACVEEENSHPLPQFLKKPINLLLRCKALVLSLLEMLSPTDKNIDDEIDKDAGYADVPCSGADAQD